MKHIRTFESFDEEYERGKKNALSEFPHLQKEESKKKEKRVKKSYKQDPDGMYPRDDERYDEPSTGGWQDGMGVPPWMNESKIYGIEILPKESLKELESYVDYKDPKNKVEVFPDPQVDGTFALRIYRAEDDYTFDLLWNKGGFDELDFETWPPKSGKIKFFF